MLRLGALADIHGNIEKSKKILEKIEGKIDVLMILGDINSQIAPFTSIKSVLRVFKDLKIPKFVMPGSHEPSFAYQKALSYFFDFRDCTKDKNRVVNLNDHDFLFLPGSDWNSELGEFRVYKNKQDLREIEGELPSSNWKFFFIEELGKYLERPAKTILISHMPPKFEGKNAIDRAKFIELKKEDYDERYTPGSDKLDDLEKGVEIKEKEKNVGNKPLKEFIEINGIKKLICGHIHESGGKACKLNGDLIEEGEYSEEFFYNIGAVEEGLAGIVTFKGKKAKYEKIEVG